MQELQVAGERGYLRFSHCVFFAEPPQPDRLDVGGLRGFGAEHQANEIGNLWVVLVCGAPIPSKPSGSWWLTRCLTAANASSYF